MPMSFGLSEWMPMWALQLWTERESNGNGDNDYHNKADETDCKNIYNAFYHDDRSKNHNEIGDHPNALCSDTGGKV